LERLASEGAKTPYSPPDCNSRDNTRGGYPPLGTKSYRCPDQSGKENVRGIDQVGGRTTEHEKAQSTDSYIHGDRLDDPQMWSGETPTPAPDEEERRHYQSAHGIAQPPGPPGFAQCCGRNYATEPAAGHPHCRTDQGTEYGRQHDQAQDIPEAIKSRAEADQALEK
jgi:hypothetical protein